MNSLPHRSSALDLLRTLAIALVFMTHFRIFAGKTWFTTIGPFGWAGVDLFFVLSGFLIASQLFRQVHLKQRISWKYFYLRRGFRIWPNYLVVLLLYFWVPTLSERGTLPPFWKFITFTQNLGLDNSKESAFSHAWSLCVEEHFYLVLPFFVITVARLANFKRAVMILSGVMVGGIVLRYLLWMKYLAPLFPSGNLSSIFYREIYYPTYTRLDGLAIGVAIAAVFHLKNDLWRQLARYSDLSLVLGCLGLSAAFYLCRDQYTLIASLFGFPLIALSFGFLVFSGATEQGYFSRIRFPGVKACATLAFAFYLTHKSVIHLSSGWILQSGIPETSVLYPLGILLSCVLVSAILYLLIEQPCLRWRERITR